MLRVGLTGGIGSGKSSVSAQLADLGAHVVDADLLAREVLAPGSDGLAAVVSAFGPEVLARDGSLDRPALGRLVFDDVAARRTLEGITHPRIAARTAELAATVPDDGVFVHDVPLLVEKHMGAAYHLVVVVHADVETRVRRLVEQRGMTEPDARSRVAAQAGDGERAAAADVWLDNTGARSELAGRVESLWRERLVPFAENLHRGIRSTRPEALALHEPDPTWPAQGARLLERLGSALGDLAVTLDHVGSTAVPGLVAKDVIDLQVGVPDLAAADAPEVVARLAEAGFPRAPGEWGDTPKDGAARWPKRFHGNADPGRVAHVHVRQVGGPGWRWALLFRDWLRAEPAERDTYAAHKRALAATYATVTEYTEAKEPWFDSVADRAEAWAARTGWSPPA